YVGHTFGPHSLEVEDMTYRTDTQLARLVRLLDEYVGPGQWTLALSADHAVAPIPEYGASVGLPAKRNPLGDLVKLRTRLEERLAAKLGPPASGKAYVESMDGSQLFLRSGDVGERGPEVRREVQAFLREQSGLAIVLTRDELLDANGPDVRLSDEMGRLTPPGSTPRDQFLKAFHPRLSGDVLFAFKPYGWQGTTKATHGSPWRYDTHVPVLWLGGGVKRVRVDRPISPAAIGVTFAKMLGVPAPAQNEEQPLVELLGGAR
ncbi:MAG: alkaline phosphatase family protein, partial [Planctomycetota bacterium]